MDQENKDYGFVDLILDIWRHIGKYVGITVCTILVYFIALLIFGSTFPDFIPDDIFGSLMIVLTITNCTGFLSGKLNYIRLLLETQEPT